MAISLVCKGCGGGSWGFEWEEAYGHEVIDRLRAGLTITLTTVGKEQGVQWDEKQIHHAVNHAYQMAAAWCAPTVGIIRYLPMPIKPAPCICIQSGS